MTATTAKGAAPTPPRSRRWRRWLLWSVVLLLLLRLLIWLALPPVLTRVLAGAGFAARWERLDLSLLGGAVELWHLQLAAPDGAEPDVRVEYIAADLDVLALLTGTLRVRRAEVDGADITLRRGADGVLHLCGQPLAGDPAGPPAPPPPEPTPARSPADAPAPWDFSPPLQVMAARVQHAGLTLVDADGSSQRWSTSVRLSDLGIADRETVLELDLHAPGALDALRIEGRGTARGPNARLDLTVTLRGLHPPRLRAWLQPLGLAPAAERIDLDLTLTAGARPLDAEGVTCAFEARIADLQVRADGDEVAAVDRLVASAPRASAAAIHVGLELQGARLQVERLPGGVLRALGFDLLPGGGSQQPQPPAAASTGPGPTVACSGVQIRDVTFDITDRRTTPDARLQLQLESLTLDEVAPGAPPAALAATLRAPGNLDRITLTGSVQLFGDRPSASLQLDARAVSLDGLRPILAAAGLAPAFASADVSLAVRADVAGEPDGARTITAQLQDLRIADQQEYLRWPEVAVTARIDAAGALSLPAITVLGPRLDLRVDPAGSLHCLGLRTIPPVPAAPEQPLAVPAPTPATAAPGPPLRIAALDWRDLSLHFRDETLPEPAEIALSPMELTLRDLTLGGAGAPAQLRLRIVPQDLARELVLAGTVGFAADGAVALDFGLDLGGVTLAGLAPWLRRAGAVSALRDGRLSGGLSATLTPGADGLRLDAALRELKLQDGDAELAALADVTVTAARFGDGVSIDEVQVTRPMLRVARRADGSIALAGLALPPTPTPAPADQVPSAPAVPAPPANLPDATAAAAPFQLGRLRLDDLTLHWRDESQPDAPPLTMTADLGLDELRAGDRTPARLTLGAAVPGLLEQLAMTAAVELRADGLTAGGVIDLVGVDLPALERFLPPEITAAAPRAGLSARFAVEVGTAAEGGSTLAASLGPLTLTGDGPEPVLGLERAVLRIDRNDPSDGTLHVGEARVLGLRAAVQRTAEGGHAALGLRFAAAPAAPTPPAASADAAASPAAAPAPAATPAAAAGGAPFASLRIDALELELAELILREAAPEAEPIRVSLRLHNPTPIVLSGPEPDALPPVRVRVTGAAAPLAASIDLTIEAHPLAPEPDLRAKLTVAGIDGDALLRVWPALADQMRNDGLVAGSLTAEIDARARPRGARRGYFDWGRDFAAELDLRDLHFRAQPDGPVLAGIDEIRVDAPLVAPATGTVHVQAVEVITPRFHAHRDGDGLHLLGLLLPSSPAETAAAAEPIEPPTPVAPTPVAPAPPAPLPVATAAPDRLRIDMFLVQGIDVVYRDTTVQPPLHVPLVGLDLEVLGLSDNALVRPETMRFRLNLEAGPVPPRDRPLLEELSVRGQVALSPALRWQADASLAAFDLTALRGMAAAGGVEIGDGSLDAAFDLSSDPVTGLRTDGALVFQSLSLNEPADGPISRYLRLPAPLDTVLFVLRNESGEHRIPLAFRVGRQGLSTDRIIGMAVTTLSNMIGRAVATSPLRVVGSLTDLVGITGGAGASVAQRRRTIEFTPGAIHLEQADQAALGELAAAVAGDPGQILVLQHELGGGDAAIARQVANPATDDCLDLIHGLRHRREELLRDRALQLDRVRVQAAIDGFDHPSLRESVRVIDRELGQIERNLDTALELLRPGADRRAEARARTAAIAVAEARLSAIRAALQAAGVPERRIEIRRPRFGPAEDHAGGRVTITPRVRSF